jgi:hypothetical protein
MRAQPWLQSSWRAAAETWIHQALADAGLVVAGPISECHRRSWSVVLQVPTTRGLCYFKAPTERLAHECRQLEILSRLEPELTAQLICIESTLGWSLCQDAGTPLGSVLDLRGSLAHWRRFLPTYGRLQCQSATCSEQLLAAGTFDRRQHRLAAQLERLLEELSAFTFPESLTPAELERCRQWAPRLSENALELTGIGVPEMIQCDDLHGWNVYRGRDGYRVIDWGDACITHPFGSLMVLERRLAEHLGIATDHRDLLELRMAYLEVFQAYAPPDRLARAAELALWSAPVVKALTWHQTLCAGGEAAYLARGASVSSWLRGWLQAPPPA